ncbi:MAG: hypothetical protein KDB35_05950 [Acidimicrobiales bacterium]|nr:hypothetical protein [Acidimicrobiales bacterium]
MAEHPEILPIEDLDPSFAPPRTIGREVPTAAGPIDVLYVSPAGLVTIVETKLWRNPEARREVVGQILDYAKELSTWGYEELDAAARASGHPGGLWGVVQSSSQGTASAEEHFVDAVIRNLRAGRLLLVVAGDGIREGVERLADYVQEAPQSRFQLALVELQVYDLDPDAHLVVPTVVGRTVEIERAVVTVRTTPGTDVSVSIDLPSHDGEEGAGRRARLSEDDFFEEMATKAPDAVEGAHRLLDEVRSTGLFDLTFGAASCVIKTRPVGGTGRRQTVLVVWTHGGAEPGWLNQQLAAVGAPEEIGRRYVTELAETVGGQVNETIWDSWERPVPLPAFAASHERCLELMVSLAEQIRSAIESAAVEATDG